MVPALLLAIAGATRGSVGVTPIEKVVQMLYDLQEQVESDGDAEAATYNTFACFCDNKTDVKTTAISDAETAIDGLQADLDAYSTSRGILDGEISQLQADLVQYNSDHQAAHSMRKDETQTFEEAYGDMTRAISALEKAIAVLEAGETSLVQSRAQVRTLVQEAVLTAQALDIGHVSARALTGLLSEDPSFEDTFADDFDSSDDRAKYDFHSGDIIGTVKTLLAAFKDKKTSLESDDAAAQTAFDGADEAKKQQILAAETSLENKESARAAKTEEVAIAQADLTVKSAVLNDDRLYLKELTSKCETKAKEWDQRSVARANEIAAITQALAVIEGDVTDRANKTGGGGRAAINASFVQEDASRDYVSFVQVVARKVAALAPVRAPKQAALVASKATARTAAQDKALRAKLVALLRKEGAALKSPALSTLAMNAAEDPFAKVKELIQSLITRLLEEEADEANHKGWCDEELAKVIKDRDYRLRDLNGVHTELENGNSRKAVLEEDKASLTNAIGNLTADLATEEGVRNAEKAENTQTVADSKEGAEAVTQAVDILAHFYGEAAQGEVEPNNSTFLQGVDDEAPPTADGAYKGSQSAATGILAMLDVIKGDFERTITSTEAAEAQAKKDFVEFERDTKVSKATKQTALDTVKTELSEVDTKLAKDNTSLRSTQKLLDTAVQTWTDLLPQCVADPGMTAEERKQARETELAALKEAYCILNDEEAGCSGVFFLQKRITRQ